MSCQMSFLPYFGKKLLQLKSQLVKTVSKSLGCSELKVVFFVFHLNSTIYFALKTHFREMFAPL